MSRIYQGGGADRRFQSNKQSRRFSPTQVQGEIKRIKQEGQAALQDMQTQDRERQRENQMADLERSAADRFAQSQLRQEQIQESAAFKMQQTVDNFELQNTQREEKDRLSMQQFANKSKFELQQTNDKSYQAFDQLTDRIGLKMDQIDENLELGLKGLEIQANAQREQAAMQAQFAQENAAIARQKAGVSALMSFADIALKGAELGVQFAEMQEKEEQKKADLAAFDDIFAAPVQSAVTTADTNQNKIEVADELAIQKTGANSIQREHMRQPLADQTMLRDIQQTEIGAASNQFASQFDAYINDPNTTAMVNGEMRTLNSLNDQELTQWLTSAARDLTSAYGVTRKEGYAAVMQYGRAVKGAINAQYSSKAPGLRAMAKGNRFEAAANNAQEVIVSGDYQRGYDVIRRGLYSSGLADGKTNSEVNDLAVQELIARTDTANLPDLKNVLKVAGQQGTELGKQPKYAMMIDKAIADRNNAQFGAWNSGQKVTSIAIQTIEQETLRAVLQPGADVREVRAQGIERLRALNTPQAYDAINRLLQQEGNPLVYAELEEMYDNGNPPSDAYLQERLVNGDITSKQRDYFLGRGKTSTQIARTLSASGLPTAEKMLGSAAAAAMGTMNIPNDQQALLKDTVVNAELANYKNELNKIIINNPDAPASVIQQKVQELNVATQKRLFDPTNQDASVFQKDGSIYTYKFGTTPRLAPYRKNESTGQAHRSFINHTVEQIAKPGQGASVNDAYLTKDQFLAAVEVWDRGGSDYSPRIKAISKHLGVSPTSFIRKQSDALGFGSIDKIEPAKVGGSYVIDPTMRDALDVIGSYESDSVGGYNAVNQGGAKNGRQALGYSGDSTKTSLFGGKGVSDMTLGEIMQRQNMPASSQAEFEAKGGLHAVGRYQFVGKTLAWAAKKAGVPKTEKFTPAVQDYLAGWLLANSSNGIGQWVGPDDEATPAERQIVANARAKLQSAYRILQNPNAGEIQRQRAMRTVGNPFG